MGRARIFSYILMLVLFSASAAFAQSETKPQLEVALRGKLTRAMAIGGESTGWSLELLKPAKIDGKELHAIEVSGPVKRFEKFADQLVRVRGTVKHNHTTERGDWVFFEVAKIHLLRTKQ